QGVLSGGCGHRDLRRHGARAAHQAGWTVREGCVMASVSGQMAAAPAARATVEAASLHRAIFIGIAVFLAVAPFLLYPVFLMKVLCFALFACAFNLLLGYG